jgi:hypothetical protein
MAIGLVGAQQHLSVTLVGAQLRTAGELGAHQQQATIELMEYQQQVVIELMEAQQRLAIELMEHQRQMRLKILERVKELEYIHNKEICMERSVCFMMSRDENTESSAWRFSKDSSDGRAPRHVFRTERADAHSGRLRAEYPKNRSNA